jgi:hypothetical protein
MIWKLNVSLLHKAVFHAEVIQKWRDWTRCQRYFPNLLMWWNRYVKVRIKRTFTVEGATRTRDLKLMEEFHYSAMYAAMRTIDDPHALHTALGVLKENIFMLHQTASLRYFLDSTEEERQENERPTLFHLITKWRRQKHRHAIVVQDTY